MARPGGVKQATQKPAQPFSEAAKPTALSEATRQSREIAEHGPRATQATSTRGIGKKRKVVWRFSQFEFFPKKSHNV